MEQERGSEAGGEGFQIVHGAGFKRVPRSGTTIGIHLTRPFFETRLVESRLLCERRQLAPDSCRMEAHRAIAQHRGEVQHDPPQA
jgi:hypothetical protein